MGNIRYRWDSGMPRWKAWLYPVAGVVIVLLLAILFLPRSEFDPSPEPEILSCPADRQQQVTEAYPVGTFSVTTRTWTKCGP